MGFKPLMDRITNLWDLEGFFTPVDLGLGFYLIRFESKADYNKVYTGGPWIIQDHYLTVRKWQPQFKADMAVAIKTAVWMRFKFLPYEYYDEESLWTIAANLGKPLKVDINTIDGLRGSYARVCVELDLSKPLEISVAVGKYDYLIEYEHIHLICFSCGRAGHRKESCGSSPAPEKMDANSMPIDDPVTSSNKAVKYNGNIVPEKPEEIGYGDWMLVTRKNYNKTRSNGSGSNATQRDAGPKQQPMGKDGPKINIQRNEDGPHGNGNRKSKGPMAQQDKNINRPNLAKNKGNTTTTLKRKGVASHGEYRFESNPLLKQQPTAQQPSNTFKPTNGIIIDLKPNTSSEEITPIAHFQSSGGLTPSTSTSTSTNPPNPKAPPDIHLLPTTTYHEFARNSTNSDQLPQSEMVYRIRDRSSSPSRCSVVDGGNRIEAEAEPDVGKTIQDKKTNLG